MLPKLQVPSSVTSWSTGPYYILFPFLLFISSHQKLPFNYFQHYCTATAHSRHSINQKQPRTWVRVIIKHFSWEKTPPFFPTKGKDFSVKSLLRLSSAKTLTLHRHGSHLRMNSRWCPWMALDVALVDKWTVHICLPTKHYGPRTDHVSHSKLQTFDYGY